MSNFDPKQFERELYERALDRELVKVQEALYLIQQYFSTQLRLADEQMKSDIARVSEHIDELRDFIDADSGR